MFKNVKKLVAVIFVLAISSIVFSSPSLLGPSGLFITTDAGVIEKSNVSAGVTIWNDSLDPSFFVNYGIFNNAEVSIASLPNEEVTANAKYTFLLEENSKIGVNAAVGVNDVFSSAKLTPYIVADLHVIEFDEVMSVDDTKLTLGFGMGGRNSLLGMRGLFGGVQTTVFDMVTLALEYDGDDFNCGAKAKYGNLGASIAWTGPGQQMRLGAYYETKVNLN